MKKLIILFVIFLCFGCTNNTAGPDINNNDNIESNISWSSLNIPSEIPVYSDIVNEYTSDFDYKSLFFKTDRTAYNNYASKLTSNGFSLVEFDESLYIYKNNNYYIEINFDSDGEYQLCLTIIEAKYYESN